jgi:large subunit ribosomal protein L25
MRSNIVVAAEQRQSRGKNEARRLRAAGKIPAVLYGPGGDPVPVTVSPKDLNKILHGKAGHNTIFNLDVQGGETIPSMIVDWQHDPVKDNLLHVDLFRIDLNKRIKVKVPVHLSGDPIGVKTQGGQLDVVTREIEIECLPDDIPENFDINIQRLEIGHTVRTGEVPLSGSMKLISSPDLVVCHIFAIRTSEVAAVEEEAAPAAQPEVVKKGKKEEEEVGETKGKKK